MSKPVQEFVRQVIAARTRRGWTQKDLAREAGVGRSSVQTLERGLSLSVSKESRIEEALGWKLGSLDRIRNGEEPLLRDAYDIPEDMPQDEWERGLVRDFPHMSRERRIELFRMHRERKPPEEPPRRGHGTGTDG